MFRRQIENYQNYFTKQNFPKLCCVTSDWCTSFSANDSREQKFCRCYKVITHYWNMEVDKLQTFIILLWYKHFLFYAKFQLWNWPANLTTSTTRFACPLQDASFYGAHAVSKLVSHSLKRRVVNSVPLFLVHHLYRVFSFVLTLSTVLCFSICPSFYYFILFCTHTFIPSMLNSVLFPLERQPSSPVVS
jgi:hypothetical protein